MYYDVVHGPDDVISLDWPTHQVNPFMVYHPLALYLVLREDCTVVCLLTRSLDVNSDRNCGRTGGSQVFM